MELALAKQQVLRKPLMLKDYLLDDLSSCSSSGFRSYPRRQCCTNIGFLLEIDLKNKPTKYIRKPSLKNPSKPASSAFQRASEAVIKAVKHLPFAAVNSTSSSKKLKLGLLPRSLSRKLLKRSFWRRTDRKEIQLWEPIKQLIVKKSPPSDFTVSPTAGDCNSSTSESNSKSNSWSDSDFTASDDSTGDSEVKILNNSNKNDKNNIKFFPKDEVVSSKRVGVIVGGDDSMEATSSSNSSTNSTNIKKPRLSEEEKEQFSPVSILDCPFDDDDEVSSPFQNRLARMEGTKKRLMKKIRRFERLTQLKPVNLEKRIASSESDCESNESPQRHSSESVHENFTLDSEEEENQASDKAMNLLQLAKSTMTSISLKYKADHDNLLFDFFKEGIEMNNISLGHGKGPSISGETFDNDVLNIASDWITGKPRELFLEWDVKTNREAYIRDMERGGKWKKFDEEKQEVALELEVEVFSSLMNELWQDLLSS